jgi:hypothetical protein
MCTADDHDGRGDFDGKMDELPSLYEGNCIFKALRQIIAQIRNPDEDTQDLVVKTRQRKSANKSIRTVKN